jgi:hypothetical protein
MSKYTILLIAILFAPSLVFAGSYSFYQISNITPDVSFQLSMDVNEVSDNRVSFTFLNSGLIASSITDIYFDDGTLLGIASIINGGSGVSFSQYASPSNLPGGSSLFPPFEAIEYFSADSNSPVAPKGVNPGEWVTIIFNLINGKDFSATTAALASGELRVGLKVQAIGQQGESASFVNKVPEPSLTLLLGIGLASVALLSRRWTH